MVTLLPLKSVMVTSPAVPATKPPYWNLGDGAVSLNVTAIAFSQTIALMSLMAHHHTLGLPRMLNVGQPR